MRFAGNRIKRNLYAKISSKSLQLSTSREEKKAFFRTFEAQ